MNNFPPFMKDHPAYQEGREAAESGRSFKHDCPYTFDHAGVDLATFNAEVRQKLNAWFAGWRDVLAERGLGFDMKPFHRYSANAG